MGGEGLGVTEVEVLPSMWPDDLGNGKQFNIEKPGVNRDIQEDVNIKEDPSIIDFERLRVLTDYSEKGSSQLAYLVKHWEYRQANAVRLLNEELSILNKQREEVELKKLEILEALRFQDENFLGDKRIISVLDEDEIYDIWGRVPRKKHDVLAYARQLDIDAEYDTIKYWKQRAMELEKLLEASIHREHVLMQMLQENIKNLEKQSSPVEELSKILKRADNFLHFVLQNAPVVFGHQDKELRYRFIYNHYPKLAEEDIIGKTDKDIFSGVGVDEIHNMKQEVLKEGKSAKREMTFKTDLFGAKTFMIYVEPVFSKAGETIGVNYMGMDVTDQVAKREEMIKLREEIAVQNAKETELNKTIHITEETMRAKQMLATMSHEIRSPLAGVVSMADILSNTNLDKEQRQLLDVMLSSGDLVLQLINDILDLSKVESGVMKLEATKFRPREVVKHVLQTAAASLQKELVLEGHVSDSVPVEVIGDVLRIRQILTNLISNAIKFTHKGKVEINLHVVSQKCPRCQEENKQVLTADNTVSLSRRQLEDKSIKPHGCNNGETSNCLSCQEDFDQSCTTAEKTSLIDEVTENHNQTHEKTVWLQCDVCDTGIGIPESALPTLFKKYMQASADHARKYGGTGLGLAICKQLIELMGGHLTVTSQEHHGSTFTFVLPCKVPSRNSAMSDHKLRVDASSDESSGSFYFQPHKFGTSSRSMVRKPKVFGSRVFDALNLANGLLEECDSFSSSDDITETALIEGVSSVPNPTEISIEREGPPFHNLEQNIKNNTEVVNRRKENCQDDKPSTSSELVKTENSKSRLACQSPSHTRDSNFQSTTKGSTELSKNNSQPKILLVEDNKINIMVAQSMMKQMGHSMDIVNNGLEAIRAFQRSHYDLILMDVCMPVMDGLQATRLIRSYEENGYWDASIAADIDQAEPCSDFPSGSPDAWQCQKRTTIIAMTANALSESAEDCLASEAPSKAKGSIQRKSKASSAKHFLSEGSL